MIGVSCSGNRWAHNPGAVDLLRFENLHIIDHIQIAIYWFDNDYNHERTQQTNYVGS